MENEALKQATYMRCELAKLPKFVQISTQTSSDSSDFTEDPVKIKKGLELVSQPHFSKNFFDMKFSFVVWQTGQISLTDCVYFWSYSVKCVSCFRLRHLIISWQFEYLKSWNKKHFSLFHKCCLLDTQNKLANM